MTSLPPDPSVPRLTDRKALALHRARARAGGFAGFLHELARDEIEERLKEVNRAFTAPALVTGFPEIWSDLLPFTSIAEDVAELALNPGAHDLVLHAMGLHWADDPVGQLIQCRNALKPDGLMLVVAFAGRTLQELRAALAAAEAEVSGGISPRVVPMAEIRDLGGLLQRVGMALPVADSVVQKVQYRRFDGLLQDLRNMGEANALAERLRRPTPRRLFARAAELYAESFSNNGHLTATFELIFLTAWSPGPGQPQPLRPGSASARLADALDAAQRKLDEG